MEFNEKLQELRKQKELTQEELAESLFVSRTAISKWESGRGYPSIDSLKAISEFFSISVDDLLSGKELIRFAEKDSVGKLQHLRVLVFGLVDCAVVLLLFLPFFGQRVGIVIRHTSMLSLTDGQWFINAAYLAIVLTTAGWGIATLAMQNYQGAIWIKYNNITSILLSMLGVLIFMSSFQPYAALFLFMLLIIKGALLINRQ